MIVMPSIVKLFALTLECLSTHVEPWHTFEDSTADVEVIPIAGVEMRLDFHLHFLGTAALGACLEEAVADWS